MPTLTGPQLAGLAKLVGLPTDKIQVAAAIALAESGGRTDATNTNSNGSIDRGLWQINSVHRQYSASQLLDPSGIPNASAMKAISSNGTNWRPWVAYTSGAYKRFLDDVGPITDDGGNIVEAIGEAAQRGQNVVGDAVDQFLPLEAFASLIRPLLSFFAWVADPANWVRIMQVIGGLALAGGGILILNRDLIGKAL